MPVKKLETIDADTLLGIPYEPPAFVVEDLLPQGLHLLAGAPKRAARVVARPSPISVRCRPGSSM